MVAPVLAFAEECVTKLDEPSGADVEYRKDPLSILEAEAAHGHGLVVERFFENGRRRVLNPRAEPLDLRGVDVDPGYQHARESTA